MRNPFEAPKSVEDPIQSAENRLRSLHPKSRSAKYLLAAALSLNSGCAVFKAIVGGVTLESASNATGADIDISSGTSEIGISIRQHFEEPGDRNWWDKGNGVYVSEDERDAWDQEILLSDQVMHELQDRLDRLMDEKEAKLPGSKSRRLNLDAEIKQARSDLMFFEGLRTSEIPQDQWVKFKGNKERLPTEPVAYRHLKSRERLKTSLDASLKHYIDLIPEDSGIKMTLHDMHRLKYAEDALLPKTLQEVLKPSSLIQGDIMQEAAKEDRDRAEVMGAIRADLATRGWMFSPPLTDESYPYPKRLKHKKQPIAEKEIRGMHQGMFPGIFSVCPGKEVSVLMDEMRLARSLATFASERDIAYRLSPQDDVPTDFEQKVLAEAFEIGDDQIVIEESPKSESDAVAKSRAVHIGHLAIRDITPMDNPEHLDPRILEYIFALERNNVEKIKDKDMERSKAESGFDVLAEKILSNLRHVMPEEACVQVENDLRLKELNLKDAGDRRTAKKRLFDYIRRLFVVKFMQDTIVRDAKISAMLASIERLEPFILTPKPSGTSEVRFHVIIKGNRLAVLAVPDRTMVVKKIKKI